MNIAFGVVDISYGYKLDLLYTFRFMKQGEPGETSESRATGHSAVRTADGVRPSSLRDLEKSARSNVFLSQISQATYPWS